MGDSLRDIFKNSVLKKQKWILDYLANQVAKGVRVWNYVAGFDALDYSVANWETNILPSS